LGEVLPFSVQAFYKPLPFRAGFGRNVHHLKCTCPFACRPVRHIVPNKTGIVSHMYTKNKELLN
jgi:hypothetical protein